MSFLYPDSGFSMFSELSRNKKYSTRILLSQPSLGTSAFGPYAGDVSKTCFQKKTSPMCYIKKWSKAVGKPMQWDITFSTPNYVSWQPAKILSHVPPAPCGYQFWALILCTIFMLWLVARTLSSLNNNSRIMVYPLQGQFKASCVQISVIRNQTIQTI